MNDVIWLALIPIVLLQLALTIYNLIHLSKQGKSKHLTRLVWLIILLAFGLWGSIAYLILEVRDGSNPAN